MIEALDRMRASRAARRRGVSGLALVICFTAILGLLALSVDIGLLIQRHLQLKTASEAGALAAALELFSPRLNDGEIDRIELARLAAARFAAANPVNGRTLQVSANPLNAVNGDVVLGSVMPPEIRGPFTPHQPGIAPVNAVCVRTRHSQTGAGSTVLLFSRIVGYSPDDFYAESTAAIDRRVVGFRPVGCCNIPMLPILVHADPWSRHSEDEGDDEQNGGESAEDRNSRLAAQDRFTVEPRQCVVAQVPDGIREFQIQIGRGSVSENGVDQSTEPPVAAAATSANHMANASVLHFGDENGCHRHVQLGLGLADLEAHGGQLQLGSQVTCSGQPDLALLHAAFQQIVGKPRIFAIGTANAGSQQSGGNLLKFAAGVVVESQLVGDSLRIWVQPIGLNSCTAIVRNGAEPNPWIGKIVLIH